MPWPRNMALEAAKRREGRWRSTGADPDRNIDRKFWAAIGMYAVLAALVWFTMSTDKVLVLGRLVEMRWIPLFVIGVLALRTVLARHAERIRRRTEAGE